MTKNLENRVLEGLKKPRPKKKRYTFILSESVKEALACWCADRGIKESPAIEEMIKQVVPTKYFQAK